MEQFAKVIKEKVYELMPGYEVEILKVTKPNTTLTGIVIRNNEVNVAPNIYLDDYFEEYNNGRDVDSIVAEIIETNNRNTPAESVDVKNIFTRENVLANVIPCLMPSNATEFLADKLTAEVLDMKVIFKVIIDTTEIGMALITLKPEHLLYIKATREEVLRAAYENLKNKGVFMSLAKALMGIDDDDLLSPMYIVTNREGLNGAVHMLNRNLMNDVLGTIGTNKMWVIPSSVHECICVDASLGRAEDVKEMICGINAIEVAPEEVLSNSLYVYTREKGLEMAE